MVDESAAKHFFIAFHYICTAVSVGSSKAAQGLRAYRRMLRAPAQHGPTTGVESHTSEHGGNFSTSIDRAGVHPNPFNFPSIGSDTQHSDRMCSSARRHCGSASGKRMPRARRTWDTPSLSCRRAPTRLHRRARHRRPCEGGVKRTWSAAGRPRHGCRHRCGRRSGGCQTRRPRRGATEIAPGAAGWHTPDRRAWRLFTGNNSSRRAGNAPGGRRGVVTGGGG